MLMLSNSKRDLLRDKGTTLGRALIGLLFLVTGLSMLMNPSGTASYFSSYGIPLAGLVVWIVIIVKIVAGGALIAGKRVGAASAALIAFTLFATLLAHMNFKDPMQLIQALKNLAIVGGLLYLMAYGPGGTNTRLAPVPNDKNGDGIMD